MNEGQKLKGKFTQRRLAASDEYYLPIFATLFYAQYTYLDRKGYTFPLEFLKAAIEADKEGYSLRRDLPESDVRYLENLYLEKTKQLLSID